MSRRTQIRTDLYFYGLFNTYHAGSFEILRSSPIVIQDLIIPAICMNLQAEWKTVLVLSAGFCVKLILCEFCMNINTMKILNKSSDLKVPICIVLLTGMIPQGCGNTRASINFQIQEVQTSYPLKFGSPIEFFFEVPLFSVIRSRYGRLLNLL